MSSRLTRFYKYVFPTLGIGLAVVAIVYALLAPTAHEGELPGPSRWPVVGPACLLALFSYWCCGRLKKVRLVEDVLRISNLRIEIEVPLRDVERVSGSLLLSPELVWIRFRRPTEFGTEVVLMAPIRLFGGFNFHPLVGELRELVRAAASARPS